MAAVLRELRDPLGIGLAALTGAGNWVLGVRLSLAITAALAVLAVKVAAGLAWPRPAARNSLGHMEDCPSLDASSRSPN